MSNAEIFIGLMTTNYNMAASTALQTPQRMSSGTPDVSLTVSRPSSFIFRHTITDGVL